MKAPPFTRRYIGLFFAKVAVASSGCWEWTAGINGRGYGTAFGVGAHRWLYERAIGPIPAGYELDHLCRNKRCVNPAHLEPVTQEENRRRYLTTRTTCSHGHPWVPENLRYWRSGRGRLGLVCNLCHKVRRSRYNAKRREVSHAA